MLADEASTSVTYGIWHYIYEDEYAVYVK